MDKRNLGLAAFLRGSSAVPDDNMFVTNFVLYGLLEAKELGTVKVDEHKFSESLVAISSYRDKNIPDGIPQYAFWSQENMNGTYSAYATNLISTINMLPNIPPLMGLFLDVIGLGIFASAKSIAKAFVIPPDNDDSSVNMALMAFLKETNSSHFSFWNSLNLKKQEYYDRVLKYAYRPFEENYGPNPQANYIDPRTYFVIRDFIEKKKQESEKPSLILPSTWLLNYDETIKGKLSMPFNTNNVDASVCANFLFGLTFSIAQKEVSIEHSPELHQLILDTTELLEFTVKEGLSKRPSLLLVYYPSKYDFYWFVARIVHMLKRLSLNDQLPEILNEVKVRLESVMKEQGTPQIIKAGKYQGDEVHWAEFLGNYAKK